MSIKNLYHKKTYYCVDRSETNDTVVIPFLCKLEIAWNKIRHIEILCDISDYIKNNMLNLRSLEVSFINIQKKAEKDKFIWIEFENK